MRASAEKLYSVVDAVPPRAARRLPRIALTSPLFAFGGAALGSAAVWIAIFKLLLG